MPSASQRPPAAASSHECPPGGLATIPAHLEERRRKQRLSVAKGASKTLGQHGVCPIDTCWVPTVCGHWTRVTSREEPDALSAGTT